MTPTIESLRTTRIAFFRFATLCGFFRGSADEVQKVSVQGFVQEKLIRNHLWEHRFSLPDPGVFPPPGDHFLTPTTENPFYDWAHRQPSNKREILYREEKCDVTLAWWENFWIPTLSNVDSDGNENGKKAISLDSKTTTLHVHHAFLNIFLNCCCTTTTWNFLISRTCFIK